MIAAATHPAVKFCCLLAVGLALVPIATGFAADDEKGFVSIFDGQTLDGWDGDPALWSVREGAITGITTAENPLTYNKFLIWRQGEVDDFVLRLEYRLEGHNSGIQYRSFELPDKEWAIGGYQADFESGERFSGILYGEKFRGILAQRGEKTVIGPDHKPTVVEQFADGAELQKHIKPNDWNSYEITAKGHTFIHKINGQKMVEVTDADVEMRRRGGLLAFQIHQGDPMKVQFRNIRLKRLPMEDQKKLVFLAGTPSHGYGAHEHNAGCLMLAKYLDESVPGLHTVVYQNGWPKDPTALDNADGIVIFCDGGGRHLAMQNLKDLDKLMDKGVGLACLHYGVEVPKGEAGDYFLKWIGGYFETDWSVNPHYVAEILSLPDHQITEGVEAMSIDDEWYYHMRFPEHLLNVTPILTCVPPDETRMRPDSAHGNNPTVRAGIGKDLPEHISWAIERPGGGRGFGFTGAHWHWNWGSDNFRTVVLNACVWITGLEVPEGGVPSTTPTMEELEANQDFDPSWKRFTREGIIEQIGIWNGKPAE